MTKKQMWKEFFTTLLWEDYETREKHIKRNINYNIIEQWRNKI